MKKTSWWLAGLAGVLLLAFTSPTFAAEKGKIVTIKGEAKCAKCALHETPKCQTVIQTTSKRGKTITYYLTGDKAKAFHETICQDPKKVVAKGTIKRVDGKREMAVTSIELQQ